MQSTVADIVLMSSVFSIALAETFSSPFVSASHAAWSRGESDEELNMRVENVQARMRAEKLDALLLTTEANVRYFTGYHSPFWHSPTRPWFAVVPAEGKPIAVVPTIGEDAFGRAHVGEVVTWPSPRPGDDDGISELNSVFSKLPSTFGRIGAELGEHQTIRMMMIQFDQLRRDAEKRGQSFVDGSTAILQTRLVKSNNEISKVESTCQAMSAAYQKVPSVLREGMSELEACNAVKRLFLYHGVDDTPYVICRSGAGSYSDIIGHPTMRKLQAGDMLVIDTGSQTDGYYCDFNRNFAVGPPSDEVKDAYEKLYRATDEALKLVRPGSTFRDLYWAMSNVVNAGSSGEEGGIGRMGHSVGLQLTEWPSIHPSEETVLTEGMVLSLEPSVPVASGGGKFVVTEEAVAVTATGFRLLGERAPKEIPSIQREPATYYAV
eukprot:gnl/TRDRNA2_/TRDRNA2_184316_c0_seq1.p1 gnl/TRDRNA2_/TRDRNA2_184316_c0~~gnl/TRDRNA2_/TRDRNA2_184316_c0_seq1.p1  ORF type:complete len:435 (-),score=77.71 gnl/TRDRNA2_/TRDRNA2_184316_c0_seq1:130-1434(-)